MIDNVILNGVRVDLIDNSANFNENQKVIEELEKIKEEWFTENGSVIIGKGSIPQNGAEETLYKYLDQRIKELKGEIK